MNTWIRQGRRPSRVVLFWSLAVAVGCLVILPLPADEAGEPLDDEAPQLIEDAAGTVVKVGNFGYGLVPDQDPGTRYAPVQPLAEAFCEDGLRVVFSGEVGDPDEHAGRGRRWGTPLRLTSIELLDESATHRER